VTDAAPPSYATRDEARAYTARVLARPPRPGPVRVYLIASPWLRKRESWPALHRAATGALHGAELLEFADVFGKGRVAVEKRVPRIAEAAHAALVLPRAVHAPDEPVRYLIGYAAAAEARELAALGVPVLVFAPGGLAAWPDVRTHAAAEPHPFWLAVELDMPALPAEPLPTVAAAFRAIGLPPPRPPRPRPPVPPAAAGSEAPAAP
jgi:hypothetical protein